MSHDQNAADGRRDDIQEQAEFQFLLSDDGREGIDLPLGQQLRVAFWGSVRPSGHALCSWRLLMISYL
jgi:hypothetical protein